MLRWVITRLVRLYPESLRRRFGDEMADVLLARYRDHLARGVFAAIRGFWLEEAAALLSARRSDEPLAAMGAGSLWSDIKQSVRALGASPVFSVSAVLLLGISVGLSTAVFSVTEAVLLAPLPFEDPEELVLAYETNAERGWTRAQVAPANFLDWRARSSTLESLTACNDFLSELVLELDSESVRVRASRVFGNFFDVLGVRLRAGRGFTEEESWDGADGVVVLGDAIWRGRFGADPNVVGQTIDIEGRSHLVVGVAPASFRFPFEDVDLWIPLGFSTASRSDAAFRRAHSLRAVGRLAPGSSLDEASAEIAEVARGLSVDYPDTNRNMSAGAMPLHEWLVGDMRSALLLLIASVLVILLVACANVSSLFLVRFARREREMSLRSALGAGWMALARLALVESTLIALTAGALGLVIAWWSIPALIAMAPPEVPRLDVVGVHPTVLAFALTVTFTTALLCGLLPALGTARGRTLSQPLKDGLRHTGRASRFLVASEVALAVVLALAAVLLATSFENARRIDPGFELEGVTTATLRLPGHRYETPADGIRFTRRLLARLRAQTGIDAATVSGLDLMKPGWSSDFSAEAWGADRYGSDVRHRQVAPGYFETLGVPLVAGRTFLDEDALDTPAVVLINEALADAFFPGENPVGRRICYDRVPDGSSYWRTIIGVVGNERHEGLIASPPPTFIEPMYQGEMGRTLFVLVRSRAPSQIAGVLRPIVEELDPTIPVYDVELGEAALGANLARERFLLTLMSVFAASGLLLSSAGIYSVLSFNVSRRMRELGVRVALGAPTGAIVRLVVAHGLVLAAAGTAAGIGAGLLLGRLMASLLYDVAPSDPGALALVAASAMAAAGLASVGPALRAARVDPAKMVRTE